MKKRSVILHLFQKHTLVSWPTIPSKNLSSLHSPCMNFSNVKFWVQKNTFATEKSLNFFSCRGLDPCTKAERERERARERGRKRARERERERERDKEKERASEKVRDRERKKRARARENERERERARARGQERECKSGRRSEGERERGRVRCQVDLHLLHLSVLYIRIIKPAAVAASASMSDGRAT